MRSASGLPSETSWVAWSSLHFLLSSQGDLAFGISKGLGTEIKIISLPAHFSISSELYIWGPRRVCPHSRYWILCSPYISLTCCISSPFFFLSLFLPFFFFFSPPFERGCQALLEHKDRNESNLNTEANLSGIIKWDKWRRLEQQFPDMLECQEPRRAVTQKDDFSAAIPLSCCPATPQYRLTNVYLLQEVKRQAHPYCLGPKSTKTQVFPSNELAHSNPRFQVRHQNCGSVVFHKMDVALHSPRMPAVASKAASGTRSF